ncbi:MAG: hypothetical protein CSA81_12085 [Acidobacteria bacterium]|nr:MAG: hypothetical protein CSA81_12085 [Acidobacteriota bacterium]
MFSYIEVEKTDPQFQWVELLCEDIFNNQQTKLRLLITDVDDMVINFRKRYQGKHQVQVNFTTKVLGSLSAFFQDFVHAKMNLEQGKDADEITKVACTNRLNFTSPENSTLKKSLATRVNMFLDEAFFLMEKNELQASYRRLEWVHLIDPLNEMAFELKMVILRMQEKFGECVSLLESWIEHYPKREEPYIGLGEMWLYRNQNQKALDVFSKLLEISPKSCLAQIGIAQAEVKLGRDYIPSLMKAFILNPQYTKDMVEFSFDFRRPRPGDLVAMSLESVANHFKIPVKRMIGRALHGVLPFHRRTQSDLLLFSESELNEYYKVLKTLGIEMNTADLSNQPLPKDAEPVQMSLFDDLDPEESSDQNTASDTD